MHNPTLNFRLCRSLLFLALPFLGWLPGLTSLAGIHTAPPNLPGGPQDIPVELKDIGIDEKLGAQISIQNLTFNDETGKAVKLGDYFVQGRPVILSLVYFGCPTLCTMVLTGMVKGFQDLAELPGWLPGSKYEVISVSIDPSEDHEAASSKKESHIEELAKGPHQGRELAEGATKGWHFLTGKENQIKALASELGFKYRYDERDKQFAHGAAIFALTPQGKISRILYGIEYAQKDLRLSLLEASSGKIGNIIDRLILFCYRYDPLTRKYSLYLFNVMQAGCAFMALIMGSYLGLFWIRQRKKVVS